MPIFYVQGYEAISTMCYVEADSAEEAIEKSWSGEVIEGTQETEPGKSIWKKKWKASEAEPVHWDGKGFAKKTSYKIK